MLILLSWGIRFVIWQGNAYLLLISVVYVIWIMLAMQYLVNSDSESEWELYSINVTSSPGLSQPTTSTCAILDQQVVVCLQPNLVQ